MIKSKAARELISYIFFGLCTTAVNFIVYFLANAIIGSEYYLVSNVIAWIFAVAFAYVTNKLFVFDSKSWEKAVVAKELIKFISARIVSLLIEEAGLYLMIDMLKFNEWSISAMGKTIGGDAIAKLIMQFVVIALNYVFSKLIIFKRRDKEG